MAAIRKTPLLRYGLAVLSIFVAQGIRLMLDPVLQQRVPFITFFAAIALTAFYGGFGPALLAIALGGIAAAYSFVFPQEAYIPLSTEGWLSLGLFAFVGLTMGLLSELMHRAFRQSEHHSDEVQRERERFFITLASIGDGVIVTDTTGRVSFLNSVAEQLTGWKQVAANGQPLSTVFHIVNESTGELVENPAERVIREGKVVGLANHTRLLGRDGRECSIDDSAAPIRNAEGELIGVVLVFRDVSEKRRWEVECAQLAALLASSEDAIFGQDPQGVVTTWNQGAERLFGYTPEEIIGKKLTDTIVPEDRAEELAAARHRVLQGERLDAFETSRLHKDGRHLEVSVRLSPIRNPDDEIVGISAIDRDIAPRKEAERLLRRSEQQLNDFFENAAVGMHWVGPDGIVLRVNQTELDMLGYTREEVIGQPITKFYADPPVIQDILVRLNHGETLANCPARLRCKDGSIKHVLIDSNGLWEDGVFIHSRCITRDITNQKRAEAALRESEERLRLALTASEMGTWEWNIRTGDVHWSADLQKIHGLKPGTFAGTFEAFESDIHPEDHDRVLESVRQAVERGQDHHLEYRIVWPTGSVHWLEARGKLFFDENHNPVRMLGICTDITERKRLEEELRVRVKELGSTEERMRSVVNHVLDAIVTIDDRGIMQTFNPAAERLFGWSASEVIGQNVKLLMPEPYHSGHDGYLAHYLQTGEAKIIGSGREVEGRRRNGTTMPIELAVSEFRLGNKRFFTGILHDITERKRTEAMLRFLADASKLLSMLVDYKDTLQQVAQLAVPDFADLCAVDILQPNGSLERLAMVHVDPASQQRVEEFVAQYPYYLEAPYGPGQVLRSGMSELIPEISYEHLRSVARDEESLQHLESLQFRSSICVPMKTQGRILGVLSFAFTESGRQYGLDDLAVAEDLAHRAVIALENARLYHEVREADRRKDEFLAMLAHELRNPLAPIRTGLDILAMAPDGPGETVQVMQRQVEHLIRLVDDLLDVSRIMRGRVELRKQPINLADVIAQATQAVRPTIEMQGKTLRVSQSNEPLWLYADHVRLVQVVENLLNNAIKYTDQQGQIDLTVERDGHEAVIHVRDNGIGIEPDLLPKIFDLFTQASRSLDRAQGGLGIGLTLVRNLIELHSGSVTVRSEGPGHGSEFTVRLPLSNSIPNGDPVAEPPTTGAQPSRRILVVDDNLGAAHMLATLIGKLGPHDVQVAHDGPGAMRLVRQMRPDMILLDIGLPGMDGFQVAQDIRQFDSEHRILLVAVTGYGQEEDRRKTQEAGFDVHLVKPASLESIAQLLALPKLSESR